MSIRDVTGLVLVALLTGTGLGAWLVDRQHRRAGTDNARIIDLREGKQQ